MIYKFKNRPLIFVFNPKTASSTILNIINQIDNIFPYDDVDTMPVNRHRRKFWVNYLKNDYNMLKKYKHCKIIFFARHPYERIISGYSKVTNGLILTMQFIKNKSQQECNKLVKDGNITFPEWCDLITSIDKKQLDFHFIPQTQNHKAVFKCPNVHVYDINKLSNLQSYLKNKFNINVNITVKQKYERERPSIPEHKKNKIYQFYKEDFDLLGYQKQF